ncbi:uncharacterized protein LOC586646 [Strongylocentrotus purpuratus]|uniref:Uncharacterized protein n=1 Tax=Strongylocentrotus purpuratus TaxID=7668 RepID=A0A7M7ND75_STRPU|nr:uncharacterized protein LOC586646 [Strongylocentrotus purpuratus]
MEGKRFEDIVRMLIYVQLFLTSVCVGSSPCMPETDRLGRYTVIGSGGNTSSAGIPSGSRVQVSVRCDSGAVAQQFVTSQCSNGTWIPPWPRCEKPCSVPRNIGQVRQFVNDKRMTSYYNRPALPNGTQIVARCRDPGKHRLIGDQRRTCQGGQWTGEEPICQPVQTQVLFYGASHEVASNGTVVVHVHRGNPLNLNVLCRLTSLSLRPPRLTTPLVNDGELPQWHRLNTHKIELSPMSTDISGMYTCSGSSSSHSVHMLFKESTEPPKNNGSCLNSCCTSSEYSCNPEGCYCDSWCEWNDNCCDDYEDVCPSIDGGIDVFPSNTTYNMRGGELIRVSSPNYPNNYNNLENLLWHVKSVHGRQFVMTFWNVRLHSIRDYVRINTGISEVFEESTQIFYLTYNSTDDLPDHYWSIHPNIWLQFSTDAFGTDRGFSIWIVSTSFGDCDGSRFQCTNGQCIHRSAACDGYSECVDSSDEYCAPRNGSCSNSCCVNSEYSCHPDGCYCDSMCIDNGNCCDDYSDVCPTPGNGTTQHPTQFTTPSLILNSKRLSIYVHLALTPTSHLYS